MKFRTEIDTRCNGYHLDPEKSVVLIGSCFTDYIGDRMRSSRWRAYPNITGTLFNPSSIAKALHIACTIKDYNDVINNSLASRDEFWMSWLTDSGCTTYCKDDTRQLINDRFQALQKHLKEAGTLIVTFGTAWIYELRERPGYVVSNCHKFPADNFLRRRLSIDEIVREWNELLRQLSEEYPNLKIIFTVSPVRHLKDGFEGNSRSKAILQLACDELCRQNDNVDYFPSFEIMIDDLRDYRFYASDMLHPSTEAVDYIWEKFQDRYLSKESKALLAEGEKVTKRLNHRPILYGHSNIARNTASLQKSETTEYYNAFITAHPNMLHIDE